MAKRNPQTVETIDEFDDDFIPAPPTPLELEQLQEEKTLAEFMADLSDADQLTGAVHRSAKGKARGAFLFQYRLSDLTLGDLQEKLRDEYQGGEFRLMIYRGTERVGNKGIEVECPRPIASKDRFGMPVNNIPVIHPNAGKDDSSAIIAMIQENSRANMELMVRMMEANKPASAPVNAPMTAQDIIALMASLQSLNGKGEKTGLSEVIEAIKLGKELSGGGDGGGSNLSEVVKAIAPALATMATQNKPQSAPTPRPAPAKPEAEKVADAPTATIIPDEQADAIVMMKMICKAAVRDLDPETYANLVIDQMGEEQVSQLVMDDMAFQMVLTQIPADILSGHGEWFAEWRAITIELLTPDDSPDDGDEINADTTPPIPEKSEITGTVSGKA